MLERQREGIAKAKAEGRYKGRAPTARAKAADIRELAAEGVTREIRVAIEKLKFDPPQVSAHVGDTIEWANGDFVAHTIAALPSA